LRVSGYAIRFCRLSPEQREEVMARTMHSTNVATLVSKTKAPVEASTDTIGKDEVMGSVYSIETFSTTDGPGIRTNVFLQGCPKRCVFCCNPETLDICDPQKHPEFAMTSGEISAMAGKYKDFLQPRNGGITISGGEPLLQPDFVATVFKRVHEMGLTTCLDTACHGNKEDWEKVLKHTDTVMLCLKGMKDKVASKVAQYPAKYMTQSKDFARYIRDRHADHVKLSLRWVLMKDWTDTESELKKLAAFAHELAPVLTHVELIPYHELGKDKWESLNKPYPLEDMEPYKQDDAVAVQHTLRAAGVKTLLTMI